MQIIKLKISLQTLIALCTLAFVSISCNSGIEKYKDSFNQDEIKNLDLHSIDSEQFNQIKDADLIKKFYSIISEDISLPVSELLFKFHSLRDINIDSENLKLFTVFVESVDGCVKKIYLFTEKTNIIVDHDLIASHTSCGETKESIKSEFINDYEYLKNHHSQNDPGINLNRVFDSTSISSDGQITSKRFDLASAVYFGEKIEINENESIYSGDEVLVDASSLENSEVKANSKNGIPFRTDKKSLVVNSVNGVILKDFAVFDSSLNQELNIPRMSIVAVKSIKSSGNSNQYEIEIRKSSESEKIQTQIPVSYISLDYRDTKLATLLSHSENLDSDEQKKKLFEHISSNKDLEESRFSEDLRGKMKGYVAHPDYLTIYGMADFISLPYKTSNIYGNYNLPRISEKIINGYLKDILEPNTKEAFIHGYFNYGDLKCILINESRGTGFTQSLLIFDKQGNILDNLIIFNEFIPGAKFRQDQRSMINQDFSIDSEFWYKQFIDQDKKQTYGSSKTVDEISIFKKEKYELKSDGKIEKLSEEEIGSLEELELFEKKNS